MLRISEDALEVVYDGWGEYDGREGFESVRLADGEEMVAGPAVPVELNELVESLVSDLLAFPPHPNLLAVKGVAEAVDGGLRVLMEWTDSESLQRWQEDAEEGKINPESVPGIVAAVARAIEAVHASGEVHGKVCPKNVYFGKGLVPKLLPSSLLRPDPEFALGRIVVDRDALAYVAPEVVTGGELGTAADAWALGIMIYDLYNGGYPWYGHRG